MKTPSKALQTLQGQRALVTGASSGLGADFARHLAAAGCHLVLVARRRARLDTLADELRRGHGVEVDVVAMDLGTRDAAQRLHDDLAQRGLDIDVLVNNAGFGLHGSFLDLDWDRERAMLDLDILTLVHLTKLFSKDMVARGRGRILQVSSIGAYQASPTYATYAAAKTFVLHFSEALAHELVGTGVTVTTLSPGITATEFLQVAGQKPTLYQRLMLMRSDEVTAIGLRAMVAGRASVVPGWLNKLTAWSVRFMPRSWATTVAAMTMQASSRPRRCLRAARRES